MHVHVKVRGRSQWYLDSGCSRHMTGERHHFLSLVAHTGGSVTFGDNMKGEIIAIGKIGVSSEHSIDGVLLVEGLKHNLLSISQMCDKGNTVSFHSDVCRVIREETWEVVLEGRRHRNVFITDLETLSNKNSSCLTVTHDDAWLWHRRCGHISGVILDKLRSSKLVDGLPSVKYRNRLVCSTCARCKHVRSSFKPKRIVSTTRPLELIHMDLCGPMKIQSRGVTDMSSLWLMIFLDTFGIFS